MHCPNCGKEIPEGTKFCPYCGYQIKKEKETVIKKRKKRSPIIFIIPLVIIVVIVVLLLLLNLFPKRNPQLSKEREDKGNEIIKELITKENLLDEEKLNSAITEFKQSIKYDQENIDVREKIISIYILNDDNEELKKEVDSLLKLDPENKFAKIIKKLLEEELEEWKK